MTRVGHLTRMFVTPSLRLNAASAWVGVVANSLIGILLTPFILGHIGKTGYGIWALVASFTGYYGLLNMGLNSAVTRYIARYAGQREHQRINETLNTAISFLGCTGTLVFLASFLLAAPLARVFEVSARDAADFALVVRVLGLATGINFVASVFTATLAAFELFVVSNAIGVIVSVVRALLVICLLTQHFGLPGIAWATLGASSLSWICCFLAAKRLCPDIRITPYAATWNTLKQLLAYGLVTTVISVADLLRSNIDAVVIATYVGIAEVSTYIIASTIVGMMAGATTAGLAVLMPRFSQLDGSGKTAELQIAFRHSLTISSLLSFCFAMLIYIFGDELIRLWVGPQFSQSAQILRVLVISTAFAIAQSPGISLMYALQKHHLYALVTLAEGIVNLGLSIIFARSFGTIGVAFGTMVSMLVVKVLIMPVYVSRVAEIKLFLYARSIIVGATVASLVVCVTRLCLHWKVAVPSYVTLTVLVPATIGVYGLLCVLLVSKDERDFLMTHARSVKMHLMRGIMAEWGAGT